MNIAWLVTALCESAFAVWVYFRFGCKRARPLRPTSGVLTMRASRVCSSIRFNTRAVLPSCVRTPTKT